MKEKEKGGDGDEEGPEESAEATNSSAHRHTTYPHGSSRLSINFTLRFGFDIARAPDRPTFSALYSPQLCILALIYEKINADLSINAALSNCASRDEYTLLLTTPTHKAMRHQSPFLTLTPGSASVPTTNRPRTFALTSLLSGFR